MMGRKEEREREDVTERTVSVGDDYRPTVASPTVVSSIVGLL